VLEPHLELVYAPLVKEKKRGRLYALSERLCCGAAWLTTLGLTISTSLIERLNLTLRHALAPLTRKCGGFCKDRTQLTETSRGLLSGVLQLRASTPESAVAAASTETARSWVDSPQVATPYSVTDHVWTFRELLTAKFEPILNQSISG
jgi:hypothetical protein